MKSRLSEYVLTMLLCTWGGAVYFLLEVAWKTVSGHPERIHWSMLVVAVILSLALERGGAQCPWEWSLPLQALVCTVLITAVEFVAGLVLNAWLGQGIWDYSQMPGNLWGQICPQFSAAWSPLILLAIVLDDCIRWRCFGEEQPRYRVGRWEYTLSFA